MQIKIIGKKDGSFQGDDGQKVEYYWYKALRESDGVTIEFGSRDGNHRMNETKDLDIEKTERAGGRFGYKEIVR